MHKILKRTGDFSSGSCYASFISGIPSEMDIKSAIGFFQCLWRVNNFLLCGYLVYDCLPEQASMPTDFSILLKFYDTLFSLENTKLYNKLNRLR